MAPAVAMAWLAGIANGEERLESANILSNLARIQHYHWVNQH